MAAMKKISVVILFFSLSLWLNLWGPVVTSLGASDAFSEEALRQTIDDYFQFFEEWTKPISQDGVQEEGVQTKAAGLEKQTMVSRRAQALTNTILDLGNEPFNLFLGQVMGRYLEEPHHREACQLLIGELIRTTRSEIEAGQNHRLWKSTVKGASDGFYILTTLEIIQALGKKTKVMDRLSRMAQKISSQPVPQVAVETTAMVASAAEEARLPMVIEQVAAKEAGESFLKGLSFKLSPIQLEKLLGKPGVPRIIRVVGIGALIGMLYDGYAYHISEQKLDPQILFHIIQTLAILDLTARVLEFNGKLLQSESKTPALELLNSGRFESYRLGQQLLEKEFKQFETAAPQFLANVPLNNESVAPAVPPSKEAPLEIFLDSFYETYPQIEAVFEHTQVHERLSLGLKEDEKFQKVSRVSLSPIELMLQETSIWIRRTSEKIAQEALSAPSPEKEEK